MDKEDAATIIKLLQEIRDLSQYQAQYLEELHNKFVGDPVKPNVSASTASSQNPAPYRNPLVADAFKKNNIGDD